MNGLNTTLIIVISFPVGVQGRMENDWYLAVAYIPPENSNYHTLYDIDLFSKLEEDLCLYKTKGNIALLGDLNSRIGRKCDFIENNSKIDLEFEYTYGEIKSRNSMDRTSNRLGDKLLDLCKAVNIQCHNGRSGLDKDGRLTCMTHAGESVVDYLLTSYGNFTDIKDFNVHSFNEFSNHSPVTFSLIINNYMEQNDGRKYYSYKWKQWNYFQLSLVHECSHFLRYVDQQNNQYNFKVTKHTKNGSMTCVLKNALSIYKHYGTSTVLKMKRIGEYFGIKNGITSFIVPNVKDNIIDSCA